MTTLKIPVRTVYDGSGNPVGLAEFQVGEVVPTTHGGTSANTILQARINLQVDSANIRNLFSVTGGGSYDSDTGIFSIDATDLTPYAKLIDLTTANVIEVTNLYFTNERADERVGPAFDTANVAQTNASASFDTANIALTNASSAFESANTKTIAADLTTANVVELTNLYFTNERSFANLVSASTTSLQEGTNLYFTNARAVAALSNQAVSIGEATITGNLFVLGNVVEFNTETLTVEDKNIVLANGSPSSASSDGAGITVDGAEATILYKNDGDKWEFNKDLSVVGDISSTGNITSPFFYSESDIALKEDVNPISNALKKVLKLSGVDFIWKKTNQKGLGVIAQDVEKIIPHIVSTSKSGYKTVQYDSLIPLLVEAIKEQQKQIDELRKKIK